MKYPSTPEERWCVECAALRPRTLFTQPAARCYPHWLEWNRNKRQAYDAAHPEKASARSKKWREDNPDKVESAYEKTKLKNKADNYAYAKKWGKEHPEAMQKYWREGGKKWRTKNPEKAAAARHRKRAVKQQAQGHHTGPELEIIWASFNGICLYCLKEADTWDHVTPLSLGGTNFAWNLVPCCKSCNSRKQAKDVLVFLDCCISTEENKAHLREVFEKGKEYASNTHHKNPYEKIPLDCLWDELLLLCKQEIPLTIANLDKSRYTYSTFFRRIGNIAEIKKQLQARNKDSL